MYRTLAFLVWRSSYSSDAANDPLGVGLTHADRPGEVLAFTATGAAVDETAVCHMIVDFDDGQVEYDGEVTP